MRSRLIVVGGFLGAGKTTLLWEAAQRLACRGQRVGLVTNDQAPDLVDTAFLSRDGVKVAEVSGSCFCCNFQGLLEAMGRLQAEAEADVLIAEPVGSCTDLSATILQPLKDRCQRELVVAPLSVLADPVRLAGVLDGGTAGLHPSAAYIFRKQLEEADIVVISKADVLATGELETLRSRVVRAFPGTTVLALSAKCGEGLDAWLDEVSRRSDAGRHLATVDYDTYAEGEAALGWLNSQVRLSGREGTDWEQVCRTVIAGLQADFQTRGIEAAHVKVLLTTAGGFSLANLTSTHGDISLRGGIKGSPTTARMLVNARAQVSPEDLEGLVIRRIAHLAEDSIQVRLDALRSLRPGRPSPTHRYTDVASTSAP